MLIFHIFHSDAYKIDPSYLYYETHYLEPTAGFLSFTSVGDPACCCVNKATNKHSLRCPFTWRIMSYFIVQFISPDHVATLTINTSHTRNIYTLILFNISHELKLLLQVKWLFHSTSDMTWPIQTCCQTWIYSSTILAPSNNFKLNSFLKITI